jgi:serine phosphatase RsbU (regulator of sigma subunit)
MLQALLLLILLLRIPVAVAASGPQTAEPFLSIWEDQTGRTAFTELIAEHFTRATPELLNAGYTSSVIWLRLHLQNPSDQALERFLELELDTISRIDVFQPGKSEALVSGGLSRPLTDAHQHRHPIFDVTLPAQSEGIWYIRLENNYSMTLSTWLHSAESLAAMESRDYLIVGTYTGLMGFALIISLYVFFSTRHRSFLSFAAVLLTYHLGFQLTNFGFAWIHVWPDSPAWAERATFIMIELSSIAGIIFFRQSLELPDKLPQVNRWLWLPLLKSLIGLALCPFFFGPQLVSFSVQSTGVLLLFYYAVGILLWRRGHALAKYYSAGWLAVILVNVFSILQAADLVHFDQPWLRSALRFDGMLLSCAVQAGFLAVAIGNQFQKVQRDRENEYLARRKLEKSLDDAHVVQEAFIPHDLKSHNFEIVSAHHPSARIGGDWLGYHHDATHKRLILAICDVTGHGLPAALLSGAIHGSFHGLARAEELDALQGPELLSMLMQRINEVVCMTAANTSLLATMLILVIDLESGHMDFLNAGHTPIVIVRDNQPVYLLEGGSPLGLESEAAFGAGHYEGRPGDTFFLYTDGLLDNARCARRLQLHHLTHLLRSDDPLPTIQKHIDTMTNQDLASLDDDCSYIICRLAA